MPKTLLKLDEAIGEIKDSAVKNALKAASTHLTDLAIRNIVDYIRDLEEKNAKKNKLESSSRVNH